MPDGVEAGVVAEGGAAGADRQLATLRIQMQGALRSPGRLDNDNPAVHGKSVDIETGFIGILRTSLHGGAGAGHCRPSRIEDEHVIVIGRTTQRVGPLRANERSACGQDVVCLSAAEDVQGVAGGQGSTAGPSGVEIAFPGAGCPRSEVAAVGRR